MRIVELLEGKKFNDLDFVNRSEGKNEINYDLAEDLSFFMQNDDDTYRRHMYPAIAKCLEMVKHKKKVSPMFFNNAVKESYKNYVKKYPIRELPESLDDKACKEICEKVHDDFCKHYEEGKYKD